MTEFLATADYVSISLYFVLVLCVGLWSMIRSSNKDTTGYFLAGKNMHWFPIGASLFASNVGAPMFIGLSGTAAASGFACAIYEWHAVYDLLALGWVFVPVYVASGAFTMPEYLKKRFGGARLRICLSVLSMVFYVVAKISSEIFSGAIFLQRLLGWNLYACIGVILVVTALYTVGGGLAAVIYTDTLQAVILIAGAAVLSAICMIDVGGWNQFMVKYANSASKQALSDPVNYSCGLPRSDFSHIWRDPIKGDIPWTGSIFGLTSLGLMVWCTDQLIVQRCLSARNMAHSKGGTVFAGALKMTSFFLFIVPGMISRILFPDEVACADPDSCEEICGNRAGCSNIAYPLLVLRMLPTGLRGIMLAALLAALMSTLTSIFNSASSMFTLDIWRRLRRKASQKELLVVGRLCVLALTGLSILWVPIMEQAQGGQLWNYMQTMTACLSPPWCWVFILALFWSRTTEPGAFWGVVISTAVGVARMVLEFIYPAPLCGSGEVDERPSVLKDVHFLHFAIIISGVSIISTIAISLFTQPRSESQLRRVTWWTRHEYREEEESDSEDDFGLGHDEDDTTEVRGHQISNTPDQGRQREQSTCLNFYRRLCGIGEKPEVKMTSQERELIKQKMTNIRESPGVQKVTAIAAVAVAVICTFLLGFFY